MAGPWEVVGEVRDLVLGGCNGTLTLSVGSAYCHYGCVGINVDDGCVGGEVDGRGTCVGDPG